MARIAVPDSLSNDRNMVHIGPSARLVVFNPLGMTGFGNADDPSDCPDRGFLTPYLPFPGSALPVST
jgi:hypothetical protein